MRSALTNAHTQEVQLFRFEMRPRPTEEASSPSVPRCGWCIESATYLSSDSSGPNRMAEAAVRHSPESRFKSQSVSVPAQQGHFAMEPCELNPGSAARPRPCPGSARTAHVTRRWLWKSRVRALTKPAEQTPLDPLTPDS